MLVFIGILATTRGVPAWLVITAVALATVRLMLSAWSQHALLDRLQRLTRVCDSIRAGDAVTPLEQQGNDELGALGRALGDLAAAVTEQKQALEAETRQRDFETRLGRALELSESEDETLLVLQNAMSRIAPEGPIQLLLADQDRLAQALGIGSDAGLGCQVDSPARCPAMRRGQALVFDSDALDACPQLQQDSPSGCAACVPINVAGRAAGVLHLHAENPADLPAERIVRMETLARQAGSRLAVLRTLEHNHREASTDPLTGLSNRRSAEQRIDELLRGGGRVVVAMADLDHFKRLNDAHGHAMGDRALVRFAGVLRQTLRSTDIIARFGGEEFVIALADATAEQATALLDRVRTALRRKWEGPAFTASFGLAVTEHGEALPELLRQADHALYAAKAAGRDRVEAAGIRLSKGETA